MSLSNMGQGMTAGEASNMGQGMTTGEASSLWQGMTTGKASNLWYGMAAGEAAAFCEARGIACRFTLTLDPKAEAASQAHTVAEANTTVGAQTGAAVEAGADMVVQACVAEADAVAAVGMEKVIRVKEQNGALTFLVGRFAPPKWGDHEDMEQNNGWTTDTY